MLSVLLEPGLFAHTLLDNKLDRNAAEGTLSEIYLYILHERLHQVKVGFVNRSFDKLEQAKGEEFLYRLADVENSDQFR